MEPALVAGSLDSMKAKANGHMTECPRCSGTGLIPAWKRMAPLRRAAGLQAKTVARIMGVSQAFLCDLEYGRRSWTAELGDAYMAALESRQQQTTNSPHSGAD